MPREQLVLLLASLCYLGGFGYAAWTLRHGQYRPGTWKLGVMAVGAFFQTLFLHWRGQEIGGCPMTNSFELFTFVSWAIVLLYFVVGPAYRLSLLGVFTSPLALIFQSAALLQPEAWQPAVRRTSFGFWPELHAALSLVAYGAFALACAAGIMFLIQDRQLKRHHISPVFRQLPPIHYITRAIRGLILTGILLLTAGILCAYQMDRRPSEAKLTVVWIVWGLYAGMLAYDYWRGMSARRAAAAAALGFLVPVASLWFVGAH